MKLLLSDDDELITMALTTILGAEKDMEIAASAACGEETVRLYETHLPDVVLTDIRMPYRKAANAPTDENDTPGGLVAAERILDAHPDACVLLLTTFLDDEYIIRALRLGVSGYLLKQDYASLVPAIRAALEGQNVFGAEITAKMPSLLAKGTSGTTSAHDTFPELTEREYELTALIAQGLSNKEIAEKMFLSEGTVRNYLSTVLEKLQLRDRTQLAIRYLTAARNG